MARFVSVQVDDLIVAPVTRRVWRVTGVLVGTEESAVELEAADGIVPVAVPFAVPLDLLEPTCIFRRVDHEREKRSEARRR
jgi:hypothetical protein